MSQVELITISKKGQIVLPKKVREELGMREGNKLLLIEKWGKITLTKVDLEEGISTMLASEKALAKDWLSAGEEKAWKDL